MADPYPYITDSTSTQASPPSSSFSTSSSIQHRGEEKKDDEDNFMMMDTNAPRGNDDGIISKERRHTEEDRNEENDPDDDDPSAGKNNHSGDPAAVSPSSSVSSNENKTDSNGRKPVLTSTSSFARGIISLTKFIIHCILVVAFIGLCTSYCLRTIHKEYFLPLLHRAERTNDDLFHEYTYYERQCTVEDVTLTLQDDPSQLIYETRTSTTSSSTSASVNPSNYGVNQMMKHGVLVLPEILSSTTVKELREFVVDKNAAVKGTNAEYPVSQGENRISYGIEATEDVRVLTALREIHANQKLKNLLEGLVGTNPAVTELTAITAYYGAPDQAWHADVKQDGNGMNYARTYSHSYSLFVYLQDTTHAMGATDICPGTHYCGDEVDDICERVKIGLHQVGGATTTTIGDSNDDNADNNNIVSVVKSGDGALLNQQVWHRGPEHTDPNALERIVFIVSFIARPNDTRQLSRGTYFHMKWNMWGHTWKDLGDAITSMAWPYNVLRCLHIWKPNDRSWGYDLIMATAMRVANGQPGCEPEELRGFLHVLNQIKFPKWLDGTIDMDRDDAWPIYISETIDNIYSFMVKVNKGISAAYLGLVLLAAVIVQRRHRTGGFRVLYSSSLGVIITHSIIIGITMWFMANFRNSEWAVGISSGNTLRRPFPNQNEVWVDDPTVTHGLSVMPTRRDVLVGTRLASKTIGAYSRWLDFHPGNEAFLADVDKMMMKSSRGVGGRSLYKSYELGLPPAFHRGVLQSMIDNIAEFEGRFLQQDYRTGVWRLMNKDETREYVRLMLVAGTFGISSEIKREIDFLLGKYRFESLRGTSLARLSQIHLHDLTKLLFGTLPKEPQQQAQKRWAALTIPSPLLPATCINDDSHNPLTPMSSRWTDFQVRTMADIRIGSKVLYDYYKKKIPATVIDMNQDEETFEIAFPSEITYRLGMGKSNVPRAMLSKVPPPIQGANVLANYRGEGEWFPAYISQVHPSGMDIKYDDGDFERSVPLSDVKVL